MTKIIVPATSANLGVGFDSVGVAVNLYLTVEILDANNRWEILHELGDGIPTDESNLIIATALKIAPKITSHRLKMTSEIPLEHGLGSSSSAIVAGILLADKLGNLQLTMAEKLQIACELEGHPDNVVPALMGGLAVASYDGKLVYQQLSVPDCALIATIPDYSVSTAKAREVLPQEFPRSAAVTASSRANVMVAALANGDLTNAGQMMERDLFHENYRTTLVPELAKVRTAAHEFGAYATYLSGAGSTTMTWINPKNAAAVLSALTAFGEVRQLEIDKKGARIIDGE